MKKQINRKAIQQYILTAIDGQGYGVELNDDKHKLQFLVDTFKQEYLNEWNLKRYKNTQKVFVEWCKGLPSAFNIAFENYEIEKLGNEWGAIAFHDNYEYAQKWIFDHYWNKIYIEFSALLTKHNIQL